MIKKGIIWFLVLAFLNFIIVPDSVFAGDSFHIDPFGSSGGEGAGIALAALLVVGLIIAGIVALTKHSKSPADKPKEEKKDIETSPETDIDNPPANPTGQISLIPEEQKQNDEILLNTNFDNQLITPSGEIVLVRW
jgi:hypothetical protein